jgi:hypothetical protein
MHITPWQLQKLPVSCNEIINQRHKLGHASTMLLRLIG